MSLVVDLAVVGTVFLLGLLVSTVADVDAKRRSLPPSIRTAVGMVSLGGVWLLYFLGRLPEGVVDDSVLAFALSIALWVGLPLVLSRFVATRATSPPAC